MIIATVVLIQISNGSVVYADTSPSYSIVTQGTAYMGNNIDAQVYINNAQNIEGADFQMTFDKNLLEVVDADQATEGIQIAKGTFIDGLVARNQADNQNGTVRFVIAKGEPGVNGNGLLATIKFKILQKGNVDLGFTSAKLVDQNLNWISCTASGANINILDEGSVSGKVTMQGRSIYGGITITAKGTSFSTTTKDDGSYTLTISAGNYSIFATMQKYLSKKLGEVTVISGQELTLNNSILMTGDADNNDEVNFSDLLVISNEYDGIGQFESDFNNDQKVDLIDLVLLARSYNQIGDLKKAI